LIQDHYFALTGTSLVHLCISYEGLVFVRMHRRDDTQAFIVRIYSAIGGEYFDQSIKDRGDWQY